jgi:AAA family ATP:ADP antiporter
MKFFASFVYTILNATKDTIIVTNKGSGAEVIPILKGGVVISVAFMFMLTYSKLSNKFSRENVFYLVLLPFIAFFICYGFYLYPNQYNLAFNQSAEFLSNIVGSQHPHWVAAYKYWMNSIFFVVAEMWGGVMISLLFWGFANQITTLADAARFYTLYTVGGHIGTISAGTIVMQYAGFGGNNFNQAVTLLMTIASFASGIIMFLFWWTNKNVLGLHGRSRNHTNISNDSASVNSAGNNKTTLSLRESLAFIIRSPYLGFIALLVIGYGISVNMVEVVWKAVLKIQYPNPAEYQAFMGVLQTLIGTVSLLVALFVGGTVIRKCGWQRGA